MVPALCFSPGLHRPHQRWTTHTEEQNRSTRCRGQTQAAVCQLCRGYSTFEAATRHECTSIPFLMPLQTEMHTCGLHSL